MAEVHLMTGGYVIAANDQQVFSFWWPASAAANAYFDVSISPEVDSPTAVATPLIEVKRERTFFYDSSNSLINKTLFLTLRNDNNVAVKFLAAHVLIE
jgi:hypothetical protein